MGVRGLARDTSWDGRSAGLGAGTAAVVQDKLQEQAHTQGMSSGHSWQWEKGNGIAAGRQGLEGPKET